jgi:cytochrome c
VPAKGTVRRGGGGLSIARAIAPSSHRYRAVALGLFLPEVFEMRRSIFSIALTLFVLSPAAVSAADLDGADLYMKKTCFSCHGKDANTPLLPMYPKLAGQSADYAYNQMQDIKSGARDNGQTAAMKGIMHLVNDDEMRAIADWLAGLD